MHVVPQREPEPVDAPVAVERPEGVWWCWVPLHGGAGATTLAAAVPCGAELGTDLRLAALPKVAVIRSHAAGLAAAQVFAREAAASDVEVLGLVITADAPGRLPRELEAAVRLAASGYRAVWRLPFVQSWRLGASPSTKTTPREHRRLLADLVTAAGVPITTNPTEEVTP